MTKMPTDFLWGVSTSAFQIEGFTRNDITEWERLGNFNRDGFSPKYGEAANHWKTWKQDFNLLSEIGVNAYRFSIDWGRIQPSENNYNDKALYQYSDMVDQLISQGITPMLTLHHFTHPVWFHERTPWHHPSSISSFAKFVEKIMQMLGDRIKLYITLNEPIVWALAAYGDGKFPPGEKNFDKMAVVLHNLLLAHKAAYDIIKHYQSDAQIGIANNFIVFRPLRLWHLLDRGTSFLIHRFYNFVLLDAFKNNNLSIIFPFLIHYKQEIQLAETLDFWGINYYYRLHAQFALNFNRPMEFSHLNRSGEGLSDLGWEIYSEGLWEVIKWLKNTNKPFYITENGVADAQDSLRIIFIQSHLKIVARALKKSLPIHGYFHWSFLDNYEWLIGNRAKFGLYEVDYSNNFSRNLRDSGKFYSEYIKNFENKKNQDPLK